MNWKDFFRPTKEKIIITVILIVIYFVFSPACEPLYAGFQGTIYPCGQFLAGFYNLTNKNPWLGLAWLGLAYFISSGIVFLLRKTRNKK